LVIQLGGFLGDLDKITIKFALSSLLKLTLSIVFGRFRHIHVIRFISGNDGKENIKLKELFSRDVVLD